MGVITTGHFAYLLYPGINKIYGQAYNELTPQHPLLFEKETSDRAYEEDVGITGFGLAPVKGEGDGISYDTSEQGYLTRYTMIQYALGFIITEEMYEDDQYKKPMMRRAKGLAFSMRQTKEINGANVYNRAFNPDFVGGDGVEMCADDHPNKTGGTWRNELETPADLSEAALEQAVIDIARFKTDRGLTIAIKPACLVIPIDLQFEVTRILKSQLQVDNAEHNINALRTMGSIPKVVANNYLTDLDAWFIRTNCPDSLKYIERKADRFQVDNDFDTSNAKYKAAGRYAFGHTDPRGIFGSPGG